MFLAIDCGNTNVVFALYQKGSQIPETIWRCRTDSRKTADEYASWLLPLLQQKDLAFTDVTSSLISSVVPNANFNLQRLCTKYFEIEPHFVKSPTINIGIEINMPKPEEVGADRLVNAVAAKSRYTQPCVIIDFGTATTFDVVDGQGRYCGGVIAPGINLSMEALHNAAAALPRVSVEKTDSVIGKDTVSAMQSGLYWGYVAMIEGIITRIGQEFETPPAVIATGGLAPTFAEGTDIIDHVDHDLTLEGLRLIHDLNFDAEGVKSAA